MATKITKSAKSKIFESIIMTILRTNYSQNDQPFKLGDIVKWIKEPKKQYQIVGLSQVADSFLIFDISKGRFTEEDQLETAKESELTKIK